MSLDPTCDTNPAPHCFSPRSVHHLRHEPCSATSASARPCGSSGRRSGPTPQATNSWPSATSAGGPRSAATSSFILVDSRRRLSSGWLGVAPCRMSRLSALGHHSIFDTPVDVAPPCITGHFLAVFRFFASMSISVRGCVESAFAQHDGKTTTSRIAALLQGRERRPALLRYPRFSLQDGRGSVVASPNRRHRRISAPTAQRAARTKPWPWLHPSGWCAPAPSRRSVAAGPSGTAHPGGSP